MTPVTGALSGVRAGAGGTTGGAALLGEQAAADSIVIARLRITIPRVRKFTTTPKLRPVEPAGLVGAEGFEPPPLPCNGSALPLSYAPRSGDRKSQKGRSGRSPVCDIRLPQIAAPGQSIASRTFVVVRTS